MKLTGGRWDDESVFVPRVGLGYGWLLVFPIAFVMMLVALPIFSLAWAMCWIGNKAVDGRTTTQPKRHAF